MKTIDFAPPPNGKMKTYSVVYSINISKKGEMKMKYLKSSLLFTFLQLINISSYANVTVPGTNITQFWLGSTFSDGSYTEIQLPANTLNQLLGENNSLRLDMQYKLDMSTGMINFTIYNNKVQSILSGQVPLINWTKNSNVNVSGLNVSVQTSSMQSLSIQHVDGATTAVVLYQMNGNLTITNASPYYGFAIFAEAVSRNSNLRPR